VFCVIPVEGVEGDVRRPAPRHAATAGLGEGLLTCPSTAFRLVIRVRAKRLFVMKHFLVETRHTVQHICEHQN
jgi:hypothetical protein